MTTNMIVATENFKDYVSGTSPLTADSIKVLCSPPEAEKQPSVLSPLNKVLTPKSRNQKSVMKMKKLSISKEGRENNSAILNVIQAKATVQKVRRSIGTKKEAQSKMNVKSETNEPKIKRNKSNVPVVKFSIC